MSLLIEVVRPVMLFSTGVLSLRYPPVRLRPNSVAALSLRPMGAPEGVMTTSVSAVTAEIVPVQASEPASQYHIRRFDYERDFQDLKDICATVYGGTDYMPRIIHRIASDPGVVVLAAEAVPELPTPEAASPKAQRLRPHTQASAPEEKRLMDVPTGIDGVICAERRGSALFLFGLRVREGRRGKGLGHLLMEAVCRLAPTELATSSDAQPPPPKANTPASTTPRPPPSVSSVVESISQPATPHHMIPRPPTTAPMPPPPRPPLQHLVTCTVSYNPAAQRIIGRQLPGPLVQVEGWPGHGALESYEAAAGWARGQGVAAGAPHMLDWLPGARDALQADTEAQGLSPLWRRVTCRDQLRAAVSHLLYGTHARDIRHRQGQPGIVSGAGSCNGGVKGSGKGGIGDDGGSDSRSCEDGGQCADGGLLDGSTRQGAAAAHQKDERMLWLPMPYEVWPLDSAFVSRELAAGKVWLLRRQEGQEVSSDAGGGGGERRDDDSNSCGSDSTEGEVVGVMILTYFHTFSRICAGILARDACITHAAIAHAGILHPHFLACTLRVPPCGISGMTAPGSVAPSPAPHSGTITGLASGGDTTDASPMADIDGMDDTKTGGAGGDVAGAGEAEPLPALYTATGGFRDFWVYVKQLA